MAQYAHKRLNILAVQIAQHWTSAETTLGLPIELSGGFGQSDFQALIDQFDQTGTISVGQENVREGAMSLVDRYEGSLRPRVVQFNRIVRALLPGTSFAQVLEPAPGPSMARAKLIDRLERVARLWDLVNLNAPPFPGFGPPFLLPGGYSQADFMVEIDAFRNAAEATGGARQDERIALANRRELAAQIWTRMVQYRLVAQAIMPPALVESLPRITPKRKRKPKPGHGADTIGP